VSTDIHFASLGRLADGLARGEFSSRELVEHFAARVAALEPALHAFRLTLLDEARGEADARDAERAAGRARGPLHGLPYVAKDLFDVAGHATSAGCPLLESAPPATRHASVVDRLEAAGMVLLGKTHTVQFAYGGAGVNTQHGTPHNPWKREHHLPGGSSSGSGVAVAAGMAPMGLGTDTGGSVRIPASLCGISGLKTTVGRISRAGVYPLSWSLDSVGPLCRDVADAARVLDVLNGEDDADPSTHGRARERFAVPGAGRLDGLRVAVAETVFFDGADEDVAAAVRAAAGVFADLGAQVDSIAYPEAAEALELNPRGLVIAAEAWTVNRRLMEQHFDALDPMVSWRIAKGREVEAADYLETVSGWNALRARAAARFDAVDVLLCPATMYTARPLAAAEASLDAYSALNLGYLRNTAIGNILNLCGISVPCGLDGQGLPIGLMIYARPFGEATALRAAAAYQAATDHHLAHPALDWA